MAKKKEEKTNVMRTLEQKKIPYTAHSYAHEEGVAVDGVTVAQSMGQDPARVFKTLVTRGASGAGSFSERTRKNRAVIPATAKATERIRIASFFFRFLRLVSCRFR